MAEAVEEAVEELVEAVEELVEDETGYGVEAVEGEESLEDVADGDAEAAEEEKLEEAVKQKREAIDKQQAFIEFKASDEGQTFES